MQQGLGEFIAAHRGRVGLVSLSAPLISNLSVWGNIALIPQYHQNMPEREAKAETLGLLRRFGMEPVAERRNPALTAEERFCTLLLRAAMVGDAVVVLDRPFSILTAVRSERSLVDALRKVDDLIAEAHIFDYSWSRERYGGLDVAAD
ncbi:MAG: P-loop NTPase family protein [Syntrophales bacterium]